MAERLDGNEVIGAAESSAQSNTEDVEKFMMFGPFHTRVGQVSKMGQQRGQSRFAHGYLLLADFAPSFPFSRHLSSQLPHLAYVDAIALDGSSLPASSIKRRSPKRVVSSTSRINRPRSTPVFAGSTPSSKSPRSWAGTPPCRRGVPRPPAREWPCRPAARSRLPCNVRRAEAGRASPPASPRRRQRHDRRIPAPRSLPPALLGAGSAGLGP